MSKHKKKKANSQKLQKIAQVQARNEFFRRVRKLLDIMHCGHVFDLISERNLNLMYSTRLPSLQVVGAKENTFDSDDLKWFKKAVVHKLRNTMVDLYVDSNPEAKIDAYTFSTIGLTLKQYSLLISKQYLTHDPELADMFLKLFEEKRDMRQWINIVFDTTEYFCHMITDLRTRLYWTNNESTLDTEKHRVNFTITIHGTIPEKIQIAFQDDKRSAIRLGFVEGSGVNWVSIDPEKLGLRSLGKGHLIDVYVQEHALNRLVERNDCVYVQYIWLALVVSVLECKFHKDEYHGNYMIEFAVYEQKTGYLVAEFVEAKLIIRTFLLLTNDGTPEGRKLHANTGLSKADKEFLRLDKLSTFLSPDIHASENLKKIFEEAGCQSLFKLKAEFDKRNIMLRKPASASLIEDYMLLNEKKEEDYSWDAEIHEN